PWLFRDPVDRVIAIRPLLRHVPESALRGITAAHVFYHQRIAAPDKVPVALGGRNLAAVRSAHQHRRPAAPAFGKKKIGCQAYSIVHGNHKPKLLPATRPYAEHQQSRK